MHINYWATNLYVIWSFAYTVLYNSDLFLAEREMFYNLPREYEHAVFKCITELGIYLKHDLCAIRGLFAQLIVSIGVVHGIIIIFDIYRNFHVYIILLSSSNRTSWSHLAERERIILTIEQHLPNVSYFMFLLSLGSHASTLRKEMHNF